MKYALIFLMSIFFLNCGGQKADNLEASKQAMMKIHDDSMAEIGKLRSLSFELEELLVESNDSMKIKPIIEELNKADEAMMEWMNEYREPTGEEELKKYFEVETQKIKLVAQKIYNSIEKAEQYVEE